MLDAITGGRTAISESPTGPFVTLEGPDGDGRIKAVYRRARGCDLVFIVDGEIRHRVALGTASGSIVVPRGLRYERYLRAEIRVEAPEESRRCAGAQRAGVRAGDELLGSRVG